MKKNTLVNHPPAVPLAADNRPLVAPIYQSVKFSFDDTGETLRYLRGEREGFFYSRTSNPTLRQLELLLAQLQGRDDCLLTGSGVATIAASLLSLCKQGDHILAFVESYGPTRYIVQHLLAKFGVTHTLLSIEDLPGIERVLARCADPPGDVRESHQSGHQDRRHRAPDRAGAARGCSDGARQYLCRLSQPRRLRHRHLPAQPDQVRVGPRRCHGRRDHCARAN